MIKALFCRRWMVLCWLAGLWLVPSQGWTGDFSLESAGTRFGIGGNHSSDDFYQGDAVLKWNLPWRWDFGANWLLQIRLQASAGWLSESDDHGALVAAGPSFSISRARFPASLELGFEPTLLSRTMYSTKNFGQNLQFTSYAGLNWDIGSHFRLGYRFQHMSNAGLSHHNPGLNMSLFGLFYRF